MIVKMFRQRGECNMVQMGFRRLCHSGWSVNMRDAARLLAGLEVALAAALREAGRGKCLKCGYVNDFAMRPSWWRPGHWVRCDKCGGILSPEPKQ